MKRRGKHKLGWKSFLLLCLALLILPAGSAFAAVNKPFPQHTTYTSGTIKPNHVTQTSMDNSVKTKWNAWKAAYLKPAGTGKYYVNLKYSQPKSQTGKYV
ncbi:hypothetical protein [Paenibacillus sp. sgz500992]|uniref:hypothetical protein n=1 Tax=Paenibacillus sp. sgz500992 TaxID=3242476 RepID=UPI0036D3FE34